MSNNVATINEQASESTAIISVIERAAMNPEVDIEKMERLLGMQERIMAKNAEMEFNRALSLVQKETPRIKRESENKQTRSKYAKLDAINKQLVPIYTAHGFALSFGTDQSPYGEGWTRTTCTMSHQAGHSVDKFVDLPLDDKGMQGTANKTAMHGAGSAMSYGRRYLSMLIFNIAITDEDDDGNAGGGEIVFITEAQIEQLRKAAKGAGVDENELRKAANVTDLSGIRVERFEAAMNWLKKRAQS